MNYRVRIAPTGKIRWTLVVYVEKAKSRNDARQKGLRKARRYLMDRPVRILSVEEAR